MVYTRQTVTVPRICLISSSRMTEVRRPYSVDSHVRASRTSSTMVTHNRGGFFATVLVLILQNFEVEYQSSIGGNIYTLFKGAYRLPPTTTSSPGRVSSRGP